ncbi:hypothetical protein D6C78_07159 [Aureobasidium pullulans]|uniref:Uncharacterized protein n=1 Tax=Aureobasidium pullulans TaxID=5580 RepID=A0A4T0BHW1_AURPU|nr:hypothetical protein D6C78_07159 [Aureobasidium pullulans]
MRELLNIYKWIEAGASTDKGVAERYVEYPRTALDMGMQLSAEGHFDSQLILELQAILDGTRTTMRWMETLEGPQHRGRMPSAERAAKADKEEDSSKDNADQAGIVARRPRTIKSVLEKAKLLPLTATNRDGQWAQGFVAHLRLIKTEVGSRSMVGLQKLLAFARESAGIIGLYQDIVATESPGEAHHYSSLANSLVCLTKQKFENVFSEVWLLVRYVNIAHAYSEFENELQDKKSSEYQKYKAAVEGHEKEFGKPHMGASRRQRVRGVFGEHGEGHRSGLSEDKQLAKSHFTKMEKLLNTALALSYLGDAFGPGIYALLIASDWEEL